MTLDELQSSLHDCQRCRLSSGRTQVVFGVGNPNADIMFVGEAPGFYEDKQGEPFVGAAGKLLTELLESIGLSRTDIYIANVIKCRPPNNRDPQADEIETCQPFLIQQVKLINPQLVCSLGNFATQTLLGQKVGITKVRGRTFRRPDFTLFPLLHPAAALHQGNLRIPLKEDFQKLKEVLDKMKNTQDSSSSPSSAQTQEEVTPSEDSTQPTQMNLF